MSKSAKSERANRNAALDRCLRIAPVEWGSFRGFFSCLLRRCGELLKFRLAPGPHRNSHCAKASLSVIHGPRTTSAALSLNPCTHGAPSERIARLSVLSYKSKSR